jgi:hypothetical protein
VASDAGGIASGASAFPYVGAAAIGIAFSGGVGGAARIGDEGLGVSEVFELGGGPITSGKACAITGGLGVRTLGEFGRDGVCSLSALGACEVEDAGKAGIEHQANDEDGRDCSVQHFGHLFGWGFAPGKICAWLGTLGMESGRIAGAFAAFANCLGL